MAKFACIFFFLLLLLNNTTYLTAQQPYFDWAVTAGGPSSDDIAHEIVSDSNGNIYVTGYFSYTTDFDPGPSSMVITPSGWSIFILKLDSDGNFIWVKTFDSSYSDAAFSICIDDPGYLYLTGGFNQTIDFDPGPSVFNLTAPGMAGSSQVFVLKLDLDGNFVWAKSAGGTSNDTGLNIATDLDGNVLVTGNFQGTADFDPGAAVTNLISAGGDEIFILKLTNNGDFVWARKAGGNLPDQSLGITTDTSGNVYATGSFQGTVDFDPGAGVTNLISTGDEEIFVLKLSSTGDLIWAQSYGNSDEDRGQNIYFDTSGFLLVTGFFSNTVDFDPGPAVQNETTNAGTSGIFLQKLDPDGNLVWVKTMDGSGYEYGNRVTTDSSGDIYLSGGFQQTVDFNPGTGTANQTAVGDDDVFVLKLDENGNYLWSVSYGGFADDRAYSHCVDPSGAVFTVGHFWASAWDPLDFDFGPGSCIYALPGNSRNFFVEKISQCTSTTLPVPDLPILPDLNAECIGVTPPTPTATHDCDGSIAGQSNVTFPINDPGTTIITWTYDDGHGNVSTQNQTVIITGDITAPVPSISSLPDLSHQCSVTPTTPSANDICAGTLNGIPDVSFPIITPGTTVVTWTYNDGNGNTSSQIQNIIITGDITSPVPAVPTLPALSGICSISPVAPTAVDNCSGLITATTSTFFPITVQGTTVITWNYTDGNGNNTSQLQTVTLSDNDVPVPVLGLLPDLIDSCAVDMPTPPTALDVCAGIITGVPDVTFPITTQGVSAINWLFDDGNGNISGQTQQVIITDTTPPIPDNSSLPDVTDKCVVTVLPIPGATDNCVGIIQASSDAVFPISTPGLTVVTWTFDDGHGNTVVLTQNIIIPFIDNTVTQSGITLTADASGYTYQWIDCNTNTPVPGATNQSFTATINGSYAVEISDSTCTVTSDCLNIYEVGLPSNSTAVSIILYPNPVNTLLNIVQENNSEIQIAIKDVTGKVIFAGSSSDQLTSIDMSSFARGCYFVVVSDLNGNGCYPVIKE